MVLDPDLHRGDVRPAGPTVAVIAEFDHIAAGPLVRLTFEPVGEEYVLAYFDSLRPVDKDDVEFTQGWSVRPRGSNA